METFITLALLGVWWSAARRIRQLGAGAGRLPAAAAARRILRRITWGWALVAALLVLAIWHWPSQGWWFEYPTLLFGLPVLLLAALAMLRFTAPALREVRGRTSPGSDSSTTSARVPFPALLAVQWARLAALFAFWYLLFTPMPASIPLWWLAYMAAGALVAAWHKFWLTRATDAAPLLGARLVRGSLPALCVVAGLAIWLDWGSAASRLPAELTMTQGVPDYGGGPAMDHETAMAMTMADGADGGMQTTSVVDLAGDCSGGPVRAFTLTAEPATLKLSSGAVVHAWTYNGQTPGPELRVNQGDLVKVTLIDHLPDAGVTIHWHGYDVPNADDGVPGVTQNAVQPGESYTYCFRANQAGTYWYHSHQVSSEQVLKGLFGTLIVQPKDTPEALGTLDLTVVAHRWQTGNGEIEAFGAFDTLERRAVAPGTPVRLRLVNSGYDPRVFSLAGTAFEVAAIDGNDLNAPTPLSDERLKLAAGGRYDLTFIMPDHVVQLSMPGRGGAGLLLSPDGSGAPLPAAQGPLFDPIHYGSAMATPCDAESHFDRQFVMLLDGGFGFVDGHPSFVYSINGRTFPNSPMFMVREGDLVKVTFVNRSDVDHPMHLHGHRLLVLSRNGEPVTGSPLWVDTLDVAPGETWTAAFRADNPGIWMDHCHNLWHATIGMMAHLAYEGVSTPFEIGGATVNHIE